MDIRQNPLLMSITIVLEVLLLLIHGISMWKASKLGQKKWFILFYITFILGAAYGFTLFSILDLLYLFKFAKQKLTVTEIRGWFPRKKRSKE